MRDICLLLPMVLITSACAPDVEESAAARGSPLLTCTSPAWQYGLVRL